MLVNNILVDYIRHRILPFDAAQRGDFVIEKLEEWVEAEFHGATFRGRVDRLDRLTDNTLRVVDYKTGRPEGRGVLAAIFQARLYGLMLERSLAAEHFGAVEGCGTAEGDSTAKGGCAAEGRGKTAGSAGTEDHGVVQNVCQQRVTPTLYYIRDLEKDVFASSKDIFLPSAGGPGAAGGGDDGFGAGLNSESDSNSSGGDFGAFVGEQLERLFDAGEPFGQCNDLKVCALCDFATICGR